MIEDEEYDSADSLRSEWEDDPPFDSSEGRSADEDEVEYYFDFGGGPDYSSVGL